MDRPFSDVCAANPPLLYQQICGIPLHMIYGCVFWAGSKFTKWQEAKKAPLQEAAEALEKLASHRSGVENLTGSSRPRYCKKCLV